MKTYNQFINEGVRDLMKPKSEEDIRKYLDNLPPTAKFRKAVIYNIPFAVEEAIKDGADIHIYNDLSLEYAVTHGFIDIVKILIANGATSFKDKYHLIDKNAENSLEIIKLLKNNDRKIERKMNESVNNNNFSIYHGVSKNTYEYIFILDYKKNILGFCTNGFRTDEMIENDIYAIGTIWGPKMGKYLYDGFISYFGRICPSSNESDLAKSSWLKKINDPNYIKSKIKGIGFYDRYEEEEDYLNTVFDIKNYIDVKELSYKGNENIYTKLEGMHNNVYNELTPDKYTIGQSRERDEYLESINKNPIIVKYKD